MHVDIVRKAKYSDGFGFVGTKNSVSSVVCLKFRIKTDKIHKFIGLHCAFCTKCSYRILCRTSRCLVFVHFLHAECVSDFSMILHISFHKNTILFRVSNSDRSNAMRCIPLCSEWHLYFAMQNHTIEWMRRVLEWLDLASVYIFIRKRTCFEYYLCVCERVCVMQTKTYCISRIFFFLFFSFDCIVCGGVGCNGSTM